MKSRTPLHLRERIAWARCWVVDHPRTVSALLGGTGALIFEHYRTTFPWFVEQAATLGHVLAGLAS